MSVVRSASNPALDGDGPAGPSAVRTVGRRAWERAARRAGLLAPALGVAFLLYQSVLAGAIRDLAVPDARTGWDAVHYVSIAEDGYPAGGSPGDPPPGFQVYAFHPLYPLILRAVGALSGLPAVAVGPWLNLAFATVAIVVLARWVTRVLGPAAAVTVVAAITAWPSSPVFQMAYTEGLALLLLVLVWRWVSDERYAPAAAAIAALSLARPLAVPLAATIAVVAVLRWRSTRQWGPVRGSAAVVLAAALATVAWPLYAGLHSGDPGVYLAAHNSFATPEAPLSPALWALEEPIIAVLIVLVLAMTTIIGLKLMPPATPALLRAWVVLYPPYLVVASLITPSLLRYMMFEFPAALCLLWVARRRGLGLLLLALVVAGGLVCGWWWVGQFMQPHPKGIYP